MLGQKKYSMMISTLIINMFLSIFEPKTWNFATEYNIGKYSHYRH